MVKRILAVLGGTPYAQTAIQHAVTLAQAHDARVTGITILDPQAQNVARLGIKVVRERIDANVSELEEVARKAGIDHQVIRETGEPTAPLATVMLETEPKRSRAEPNGRSVAKPHRVSRSRRCPCRPPGTAPGEGSSETMELRPLGRTGVRSR